MALTPPLSFGPLLKQLRKRAGMTQRDLGAALGYSSALISSLEKAQRRPDLQAVRDRFIPALGLQDDPASAARLIEQAALARGERPPAALTVPRPNRLTIQNTFAEPVEALPAPPTALIGRDAEVNQLCNRLLGHGGRLLTLVGPPGVGKTRLALAVAAQMQHHYGDGVRFVPLAAVAEPLMMAATIIGAVAPGDMSTKPPERRLIELLRHRALLLVLDNLEQIAGAASLISTLLAECPAVTILATSRERLHLRAEQRFKVPPLELGAAVELFVRRAQSVESAFEPMPEQEAVIAAICHRLDCLPLALELCAAQIELFSPAQLLTQLRKRPLDILVDGAHDLPPPQRTLRQAIERSYTSLNAEEQRLFRTLGVFVGGFDLAMVMDFGFAETTLYALLNKSLVSTEIRGMSERRFLLLETIREYAHERLSVVNELMSVSKQHADYFFKLVEEAEQHFRGSAERQWFERLTGDYDNLRTALDWLIRFNVASGQQMAGQLAGFWYGAALFGEGRGWLTRALAASSLPTPSRANALQAASKLAQDQNDNLQAYQLAQESLTLFESQENPAGCAGALNVMGWALADMEQPAQALSHFEQSLHKARQARHLGHIAFACTNIANMLIRLGASDKRILPLLRESKPLYHQINRISGQAYVLRTEARLYLVAGDYARAALLIQEALSLLRPLGVQWEVAATLEELADSVWRMGDDAAACTYLEEVLHFSQKNDIQLGLIDVWYDFGQIERCLRQNLNLATQYYCQSLKLCLEKNYKKLIGRTLVGLACVAQTRGDATRTARMIALAQELFAGLPPFFAPSDRIEYAKLIEDIHAEFGEIAFISTWGTDQSMSLEQAVAYALAG